MRLAAQRRGGFYPAHQKAIAHAATFIRPPNKPFTILDPCAGEGAAIRQLGSLLGCLLANTFAIELDESRAVTLHRALPEAHILAPASFLGCRASPSSFPFIWLNPPFDDCYDGHRVEQQFLTKATDWLMSGGVLAFVCPERVVDEYSDARRHLTMFYDHCKVMPFPEGCRPFHEVVVFGHKRAKPKANMDGSEPFTAPADFVYQIPPGTGPRVFQKFEPTEPELERMLGESPLRSHLLGPGQVSLPSPPLALGIGHVALLLANGHLDGVVHADGKPPHVVRGTSRKSEHVSAVTDTENADGGTTTKTTITERIELMIRTVDATGHIRNYLETDAQEA